MGRFPPIIFARIDRPMNALQTLSLTVFTQINFVVDFLHAKCDFTWKTATYDVHLRLIGKRVVNFLVVLMEPFLLDATAVALRANID